MTASVTITRDLFSESTPISVRRLKVELRRPPTATAEIQADPSYLLIPSLSNTTFHVVVSVGLFISGGIDYVSRRGARLSP